MNKYKNVALVTWIGNGNFGTSLQSYALQKKIKDIGCKCYMLQEFTPRRYFKDSIISILTTLGLINLIKRILSKPITNPKLSKFIKENYSILRINNPIQYKRLLRTTDVFITGSDQIWNTHYKYSPFYFLDFTKHSNKCAYASSIGASDVKAEYAELVKNHLLEFKYIGVREQSAVQTLSNLTGRNDIIQVSDPTFLLTSSDWHNLSNTAELDINIKEDYIFCYLIGNRSEYKDYLLKLKEEYKIIVIPSVENPLTDIEGALVYQGAGPKEFVKLLSNAKLVCTDSFHAVAISINLSKEFRVFMRFANSDTVSQNSRIIDLLLHYNLTNRIFPSELYNLNEKINYAEVHKILECDRQRSMSYLLTALDIQHDR